MIKAKFCLLFLTILLILSSCNWFEPHEFVVIAVHNQYIEPVLVDTGLTGITTEVPAQVTASVQIVAGVLVEARGKNSKTVYSKRVFYRDGDWFL
jgi:hypothetical protein